MASLINISEDLCFSLSNSSISYLFRVSPEGVLEHLYFGDYIDNKGDLPAMPRRAFLGTTMSFQGVENYCLSTTAQEYPLFGTSDVRHPALHLINAAGNSTNTFLYHDHEVVINKPDLSGLPSARGANVDNVYTSETLIITLKDEVSQLRLQLFYTVYQNHDVIARSAKLYNDGKEPVQLSGMLSASLDLPEDEYDLLHLRGSWCREFSQQRMPLPAGRFTIDSASGTSSNHHSPFMAVMHKDTTEQYGRVVACSLVYSGNYAINVEQGEFDAVRLSIGINPFNFSWILEPGESFTSPEALLNFSSKGLNGMSQNWHSFIEDHISPPQFVNAIRPSYLNSWEATYFDINEQLVLQLADKAVELELEMLVVDDGWFQGRNSDETSLGDWFSDKSKFPNGIESVAAQVQQKGLKFGLWLEPEMVSEKSELYQSHPEWVIHVPNRTLSTGRNQLILDLSRQDVVDYLFERIDTILSCGHIDYIKWDMNRVMSEIGSAGLPADRQLETAHRYMLGLYSLLTKVVGKYPNILFENCAAGGNRCDLGMLSFMSQGWISDMSEPISRLSVINGASYFLPMSVMSSYIGPTPSHQNDRMVSMKLRAELAFFAAARGISLNQSDIDENVDQLKAYVEFYKKTAADTLGGRFYRLKNSANEVCWQLSSKDGNTVYLGYFHILSGTNLPYRRVRLVNLEAKASYQLQHNSIDEKSYGGDALMNLGFDLPYVHSLQLSDEVDYMDKGDFSSCLMVFNRTH